jgi:mannosyltransferase
VWRDEAATWQVAERSTPEIMHMLGHVDVVHGLYYLLMHVLFMRFGPGTTTLRMPSVLGVGVAAACVAAVGRRLAGPTAGLAAGMAFGLLPAVQFYAQEGRPYALVAAGAGVATLLLVHALRGRPRRRLWAGYGCAVMVCGLLNWFSLLLLAAHLVTMLWSRAGRPVWAGWAVGAAGAVTGLLPRAVYSGRQSGQVSWIPPLTWHMLIGPAVLLAVGAACAVVGRSAADPSRTERVSAAQVGLPLLAVPQLGLAAVSLFKPLFLDRYVLFSQLGLALLVGTLIGAAARAVGPRRPRLTRCLLPAVVIAATLALLPQSLTDRSPGSRVDDVLAVASDVRRLGQPGDAVVFVPSARRDTWSVSPGAFTGLRDIALAQRPAPSGTLNGVEAGARDIRTSMLAQRRILLVTVAAGARPPTGARDRTKLAVLREHFTPVADAQVRGRRVTAYRRTDPAQRRTRALPAGAPGRAYGRPREAGGVGAAGRRAQPHSQDRRHPVP